MEPNNCTCPGQNYTCQADGVIRMEWENDAFPVGDNIALDYSLADPEERSKTEIEIEGDGVFLMKFIRSMIVGDVANISSTMLITNLTALNGTNITCEVSPSLEYHIEITSTLCIIGRRCTLRFVTYCNLYIHMHVGPALSPTNLSLVCDSSSVVVSFQPPVYGAECVDYYTVTAISDERNVTCSPTSKELIHKCILPIYTNVNNYTFTVYSVTGGANGTLYYGNTSFDCSMFLHLYVVACYMKVSPLGIPFPGDVRVNERGCGLQYQLAIFWEVILHLYVLY